MALIRLAGTYKVAGRFDRADQWNKEAVTFADTVGNPTLSSVAAVDAGHTLLELGKLEEAHALFVPAYTALDSPDADVISTYGFDPLPGSLAFDARAVWAMGYPDQGLALMERALEAARACDHPFTLCLVLGASTQMQREFGRPEAVVEALEELERILADYDFPFWRARALDFQGQVAAGRGDLEGAVGLMQDALAEFRAMGIRAWTGELFAHLVEVEHQRGNSDRALQILTEGEQEIDRYGAPLAALHLSVQRGAVLRRMGDETAREALLDALSAADSLGDRCSALETATELALLSEAEGRDAEAVDVLAPRYEWFTSGFNTPLLVAAREVLGRL